MSFYIREPWIGEIRQEAVCEWTHEGRPEPALFFTWRTVWFDVFRVKEHKRARIDFSSIWVVPQVS